jgi:phosphohistidine phosphatase
VINLPGQVQLPFMKLYLMRHGIALDRIGGAVQNDFQRPLTEEGRTEATAVALALKRFGVGADVVVSSPLVRAKQTAEIISDVFAVKHALEITEALAPGGGASDLYKVLRKLVPFQEAFLVGHEPDIGRLAGTLLWSGPDLNISFKKAGVCRIDVFEIPPTSPGELKWFLTPKILTSA